MFPILKFPPKFLNHFCHVTEVFSKEEIEKILDMEDIEQFHKAAVGIGDGGSYNPSTRESEVMWIQPLEHTQWLFQKFGNLASHVNYDHFMYNITGIDAFQFTKYDKDGHYNWHCDSYTGFNPYERKISATILLSDPKQFDGGEFEIIVFGNVENSMVVPAKMGDVIFFDSAFPHRVRPVTKGIRKSLVAWIYGPRELINA